MDSISNLFKWKKKNKDDDNSSSNSDNENTSTTKKRNKMQKDVYVNGEIVKALWKGGKNKKFKFWYEATVVKRNKDGTYKLNYSDGSKDSRVHPKYICPTDSIPRRKNEIGHPTSSISTTTTMTTITATKYGRGGTILWYSHLWNSN